MNNMKRMRGRNHRGPGGGGGGTVVRHQSGNIPMNRNHVFDSNGPDLRLRGTAQQLSEKYLQLGRDATGAGDRVMAESYFQYAEHYFRIVGAMQAAQQGQPYQNNGQQAGQNNARQDGRPNYDGNGQGYGGQNRGDQRSGRDTGAYQPEDEGDDVATDRMPADGMRAERMAPEPVRIVMDAPVAGLAGLGDQPEPPAASMLADVPPPPPPIARTRRAPRHPAPQPVAQVAGQVAAQAAPSPDA